MEQENKADNSQTSHKSSDNKGTSEATPAKPVPAVEPKSTDRVLKTSEQETTHGTKGGATTADREAPSTSESKPRQLSTDPTGRLGKVRTSISAQSCGSPVANAVALETMATGGDITPEISGSVSRSSLASMESSVEIQKKGKKLKRSGKKRRKRRQEGGRDAVVVVNRTNILRDPFHVCVGRPFPNEEEQTAEEATTGSDADKVVAYVTSTNVNGTASAAIEKVAQQVELVKEKAILDAVLSDLIDLLELHSVKPKEKLEAEASQPNGLISPHIEKEGGLDSKRKDMNSNLADTCQNEIGANHLDVPAVDARLAQPGQPSSVNEQEVSEKHPLQCLATNKDVRQNPTNSTEANPDNTCGNNQYPTSSGTTAASESRGVALREYAADLASAALKVYEAPLVFFSMSLTDSSDRNQPAPSKDSSGYLGGSETEPAHLKPDDDDDRGFLDMAFGAGSFTDDYGLGQMSPDVEYASSPTTIAGGCNPGCWNNLLRPIKMVSKCIQTDCWKDPASESSFSEVVRQTSHHKSSTKILQRPCSMQISVPQRRAAAGVGSNSSSAEELEKIFAAYSPSSKPGGKGVSGRADMKKGMLRDRNFILPSSTEGGSDTAPASTLTGVVRQCTLNGGSKAAVAEDGPKK